MRRLSLAAIFVAGLVWPAIAQDFPARTVRLVVNSQAGGTADQTTRLLADELSKRWNQSVIVENVLGAGGNTGAAQVARSEPDGHTLLVSHPGPLTINGLLFKSMPYDPKALVPISILVTFPNALVVSRELKVESVAALIAYGKANPGKLTYGSQGVGTTTHLAGSLFGARTGIEMVHVPYRGSPAAIMDLTGGRLAMMFDNLGTATPQHQAGNTRILAVADDKRSPALPEIPTLAEAGIKDFRSVTWFGLMAPEKTSPQLIARISRDIVALYKDPAFVAKLRSFNVDAVGAAPEEAAKFIAQETVLWSNVVRDAKISPE
jgi:tripartite-type tricarboxylate transporter receptor subunit TctC